MKFKILEEYSPEEAADKIRGSISGLADFSPDEQIKIKSALDKGFQAKKTRGSVEDFNNYLKKDLGLEM